jgi:hypothetical protein
MEANREMLVYNIKSWITLDSRLKELQKQIKVIRKEKKLATEQLTHIMRENDIDCFDINDGKLIYCQRNIKKPLSKKHLLDSLTKYFKNKEEAKNVGTYIMDTRGSKMVENIRIKK